MAKRVQSPSSINMYRQCPRKYFYRYILKYPTKENIHLVRGVTVHEVLEKFFDINHSNLDPENYKKELSGALKNLFEACWAKSKTRLNKLPLTAEEKSFYYRDSMQMVANWANHFFCRIDKDIEKGSSLTEAFEKNKPFKTEAKYQNNDLGVMGFIDVIEKDGKDVILIDYKTSKKSTVTQEYKLQLGIYALLYFKKHNEYPKKVGVWFLKDKLIDFDVDEDLIKFAQSEVELIHIGTESDCIADYPRKQSPLCKYSTGQCDFYEVCMKNKNR